MRWLWAAYRTDSFLPSGRFPTGMSAEDFRVSAEAMLVELIRDGHDGVILKNQSGTPVGFVTMWRVTHPLYRPQIHPHVDWFSWATPRNRLETMLALLIDLKKEALVIVVGESRNWPFYAHLCKYGVGRRVGTFHGYWADGTDGAIFETVTG